MNNNDDHTKDCLGYITSTTNGSAGGAIIGSGGYTIADSSITYSSNTLDAWYPTDIGTTLRHLGIRHGVGKAKCSSCGTEADVGISYSGTGIDRNICKGCCTSVIDRLFGVNINPTTEKLLYGK